MSRVSGFRLQDLDWKLNFSILFLMAASLLSLAGTSSRLFHKQILWYALGIILFFFVVRFDWRPFVNYRGIIIGFYIIVLLLLVLALFFAPTIRGTKGWIQIGDFQFQPAELAKLSLIAVLAQFFSKKHISIARVSNLSASFFYFAAPALLIAFQPDMGSALILFFVWFGFLLISGIRWRHIFFSMIIFLAAGFFMWNGVLEGYQKERIIGLFSPERDPLGINYSVIQSKIAIGSAGFFGKGFGQGTQTQLGFLTEPQTDFIFAAFIEEWGVLAGALVVFSLIFIVLRIIKIGFNTENNFNRFVCLGTAILFITQFMLNVGSNLGLTPVIGVTFPFLSYGGSSLLVDLILIGIIQSAFIRKI